MRALFEIRKELADNIVNFSEEKIQRDLAHEIINKVDIEKLREMFIFSKRQEFDLPLSAQKYRYEATILKSKITVKDLANEGYYIVPTIINSSLIATFPIARGLVEINLENSFCKIYSYKTGVQKLYIDGFFDIETLKKIIKKSEVMSEIDFLLET